MEITIIYQGSLQGFRVWEENPKGLALTVAEADSTSRGAPKNLRRHVT